MKSSNKAAPRTADDLILIGRVVGAHGIRGAVKIHSYAESEDLFALQEQLVLMDAAGLRHIYDVAGVKAHNRNVRVNFSQIETRDQAEALRNWDVYIPKSVLPPLAEDEYYWIDLVGLAVYSTAGEYLGRISEIIPTGANDVYVVQRDGGGELLIPAIESVVLEVDLPKGRMRVELPEGL